MAVIQRLRKRMGIHACLSGWMAAVLLLVTVTSAVADAVVVTSKTTEIRSGNKTLARARKGQRFKWVETKGSWHRVRFTLGGKSQTGWIHKDHVRLQHARPAIKLSERQKQRLKEANALNKKGSQLYRNGKFGEAIPLAKQVLAIRKEILGDKHPHTATALNNLGVLLKSTGDHAAARPYLVQALAIRKEVLGEKHPQTAGSLNNLGSLFLATGDYKAARPYCEQALAIRKEIRGEKHPETLASLNTLGMVLLRQGHYAAARPHLEQALAFRKEVHGEKHPGTAQSLNSLGLLLKLMGNYAAARPYYEQALAIRKEVRGEKHPDTAQSLNNLGLLLQSMGDYAAARSYFEQALAINKEVHGEKHPNTAISLNSLGSLFSSMGDYAAARPCYEQALAICKDVLGEKHPHTAQSLNNLGLLLKSMGDYAAARPYHEQALAIRREVLGEKHPDSAQSLNNLGLLLKSTGDYAAARPYYQQALAIRKDVLGEKHPQTAQSLNNLGMLLLSMGDYSAARPHFEQALAICKETLGEKHPNTAMSLNNLGLLLSSMGDSKAAKPYLEQAFAIHKEVLGEKHRQTATSLNNLGLLLLSMGDSAAARPYSEQALAIRKEVLGEKHADTAQSLNNLGWLLHSTGDYAAAKPYYEQALAIYKEALGEKHPSTALSLSNLGGLFASMQMFEQAAEMTDQSRRVVRRHVARVLPGLSEMEQLTFLKNKDKRSFHVSLSLGLLRIEDAQIAASSAGWLLNGKAVAQEALAARALLARDTSNPAAAKLSRDLLSIRGQLARLSLEIVPPEKQKFHRQQLARLERQQNQLNRQLGRLGVDVARPDPWVSLEEVRRKLAADSVLIDIARFNVLNFQAKGKRKKWQPAHYGAWIIPPHDQGSIRIVDLGEAATIDQAVRAARAALNEAPQKINAQGEPEAEQLLQEPLKQLAALVLEPLLKEIGEARQLIISPDASLWLVPWGALPLADGKYSIEEYQISYVVSGRDLLARSKQTASPAAPVILADPDFDIIPSGTGNRTGTPKKSVRLRSSGSLRSLPNVGRLPGTAAEARAITPNVERYTKQKPQVFLNQRALESVYKKVRRPEVLVLSTHGFFLEDQRVKPKEHQGFSQETRGAVLTTDGKPLENPLLRCGLLLAGCNNRQRAAGSADDGVLTGMEIVGTDLRGTKLVVLSACETGLGDVQNGEGVAGLRQAFQLAGAESVVATLWQVSDRDTAFLMKDFFTHLADGQTKADALRKAQLARIESHRKRYGAAHPFFWAAFTLTSRGQGVSGQ